MSDTPDIYPMIEYSFRTPYKIITSGLGILFSPAASRWFLQGKREQHSTPEINRYGRSIWIDRNEQSLKKTNLAGGNDELAVWSGAALRTQQHPLAGDAAGIVGN
jgi:hypothetical protein